MAHCPPEVLDDLEPVFAHVRTWPFIVQQKAGVYYVKRTPFLHFHVLADGRVADARDGRDWGERIELAYPASRTRQQRFLHEVRRRYEQTVVAWVGKAARESEELNHQGTKNTKAGKRSGGVETRLK